MKTDKELYYVDDIYRTQAKVAHVDESVTQNFGRSPIRIFERRNETLKVYEDQMFEVTKENRFDLFNVLCPSCGHLIVGRPAEHPYYIRKGNKYLWLCHSCGWLKDVDVIQVESEKVS